MTTNFPDAIDSYTDPVGTQTLATNRHVQRHVDLQDAVRALEEVVGVTASQDPMSVQKRLADVIAALSGKADVISPTFQGTVAGITAAMVGAPNGSGSSTGTNTGDETASSVGSLIAAAADKATPADADSLALSDSAAGGILQRFSWASLKGALNGFFARLDGVFGGQKLIGGTAAGENLTLQSTAHATKGAVVFGTASEYDEASDSFGIGTLAPLAKVHCLSTTEQLRLGYDAANYTACAVGSTGNLTLTPTGGSVRFSALRSTATLGNELLTNGGFDADLAGWADSGSSWSWAAGAAAHAPGSISTLSQSITVQSGATYEISFTITGRTAGSIGVSLGAVGVVSSGWSLVFYSSANRTVTAGVSGPVALSVTPTSDFNGSMDSISVRIVTIGSVVPALVALDAEGAVSCEIRSQAANQNVGLGTGSMRSIVTGTGNTAVGAATQYSITDGSNNCAVGAYAQYTISNGSNNCALGRSAQNSLSTGYDNTSVGYSSQRNLYKGWGNTTSGARAASYLADGVSAATDFSRCVYLGQDTRVSGNGAENEIAIGSFAVGLGSNTAVIGTSSITMTKLFGDINLDKTITAVGAVGAQTINKTIGSVNFAAGATSLTVTNNRVTAASVIHLSVASNDATMKTVSHTKAAGSFTIYSGAAPTAETRVDFIVLN